MQSPCVAETVFYASGSPQSSRDGVETFTIDLSIHIARMSTLLTADWGQSALPVEIPRSSPETRTPRSGHEHESQRFHPLQEKDPE
jgi:hypothetical protein